MKMRIDYHDKFREEPLRAMLALEKYVHECGLEPKLLELVKMRASQINGCAYCIDMHTKDARALGETEQRIYALPAWRETPFFSPAERAALALTEAITLVHTGHVPDDVYEDAAAHFGETELASLMWAATVINAWNRIAISERAVPGSYEARPAWLGSLSRL